MRLTTIHPAEYLAEVAGRYPGALESHWIPTDRSLWQVENYPAFLAARRELLAQAANRLLDGLRDGPAPELPVLEQPVAAIPGSVAGEDEERLLHEVNAWGMEQGLPAGEALHELADAESFRAYVRKEILAAEPTGVS